MWGDLPDVELGIYMDPPRSAWLPGPGLEVEVLKCLAVASCEDDEEFQKYGGSETPVGYVCREA